MNKQQTSTRQVSTRPFNMDSGDNSLVTEVLICDNRTISSGGGGGGGVWTNAHIHRVLCIFDFLKYTNYIF